MRTLIPWTRRNSGMLDFFRNELEDLTQRMLTPGDGFTAQATEWTPRVDVEETETQMIVKVDLPGIDPKDVEVTVREGYLVLKGERKEEHEEKGRAFHRTERYTGEFYRAIPLMGEIDSDTIVAEATNGVLTVKLPKKQGKNAKRITIKTAR